MNVNTTRIKRSHWRSLFFIRWYRGNEIVTTQKSAQVLEHLNNCSQRKRSSRGVSILQLCEVKLWVWLFHIAILISLRVYDFLVCRKFHTYFIHTFVPFGEIWCFLTEVNWNIFMRWAASGFSYCSFHISHCSIIKIRKWKSLFTFFQRAMLMRPAQITPSVHHQEGSFNRKLEMLDSEQEVFS